LDAAKECAKKGVKALVVISAGFAESGEEGRKLQQQLVEICRHSGMRLVGPNCMGVANTNPEVSLNAQFSPNKPAQGSISFLTQSGALGIAVIDLTNMLGLGLSSFVSVGNKADISGNDLLEYWEGDDRTKLILLYLESFGNPRKFSRIARRLARKKPIIVVKSGRSSAGFRATQSHTGALVAASDVVVDALFRQSGVIRTDTLEEMFDVAALISSQPLPMGGRVGILTNAGGAGILAADACEDLGLEVPELSPRTQEALRGLLPAGSGVRNPVDMTASAVAEEYDEAIRAISNDPGVDAMMVIFVPPIQIKPQEVAEQIMDAVDGIGNRVPVLATFMATHGIQDLLSRDGRRIPSYPFPEAAVRSLAKAVNHSQWLQAPEGKIPEFSDVRKDEAMAIVAGALRRGGDGWLSQAETAALLDCYGISQVKTVAAGSAAEAGVVASRLGGSVVLKAVAPGLVHKTDAGAVKLGIQGEEVERTAEEMEEHLRRAGWKVTGFVVQPQVSDATEMFAGVTNDPTFGPVVACGAGGTLVELTKDVSVRMAPLTDADAMDMVHTLKTFPLLNGYRGSEKRDVEAFEQLLLRTGKMADEISAIIELDLNPVMVMKEGATVVDSRIRVTKSGIPPLPLGAKKR
jgi:acetate---CoA ligase (ADP-forming)